MPKARARRASAWPMRPMPTMPRRLPVMRRPSIQVGDQPVHRPSGNDARTLDQPPRGRKDQRHRHVRRVLGQDAGRVGDRDAAAERAGHVNMIDAVAEIGDQPHLFARLGDHGGVDLVGDGRHQNVGLAHRLDDLGLRHRLVFEVETGVEQLAHAGLDEFRQPPRDHHEGFFLGHERRSYRPRGAAAAPAAIICVPRLRMSSRRVNDRRRKWIRRRAHELRSAGLASLPEERAKTRMAGSLSRKAA